MALYVGNTRYKVMMGNQKHDFVVPLPYDAEVEWLQSDGNAYIDTGIKVAGNLSANIYLVDFFTSEFVGKSAFGGLDHIAEGDWDSDTRQFGFGINPDGKAVFYYDDSSIVLDDYSTYPQSARVVIENGVISIGSEQYTYTPASFTTLMSIILFGWHTGPIFNTPCKMGPCYLSDGTTTLDLIPVRKDGVGYMYDKISGKLFGREETGSFIIGPDKVLPYDAEVEYLESTGTQWIDTLLMFDSEYKVELTALLTPSVSEYYIIGNAVRNGAYAGKTVLGFYNNFIFFFNSPNTRVDSSTFAQQETLFNIVIEANNNNRMLTVNGVSYTKTGVNYSSEGNIVLFRGGAYYIPSSVKIKSFKMIRGGEVVRDLISVRAGQVGYMYDKVSKQLFENAGTGNFILGNDVTT